MERWSVEHRVFAVEQFFRNNDTVVTVQRLFHWQLIVGLRDAVQIETLYSGRLQCLEVVDLGEKRNNLVFLVLIEVRET